jgi:predicted ABC-type ATPase
MTARPVLLIIAGPNGSGKSTLTQQMRDDGVDLGIYINPDEIALQLRADFAFREVSGAQLAAIAQKKAGDKRQDCLASRLSFSFETVMSHPSKIDVLKQARRLGYFVMLYFVATASPTLNVQRVRQRVALGGHAVPEDRIVSRYERTLALLPQAIAQCDRAILFDNSYRDDTGRPVIQAPFFDADIGGDPAMLRVRRRGNVPAWFAGVEAKIEAALHLRG